MWFSYRNFLCEPYVLRACVYLCIECSHHGCTWWSGWPSIGSTHCKITRCSGTGMLLDSICCICIRIQGHPIDIKSVFFTRVFFPSPAQERISNWTRQSIRGGTIVSEIMLISRLFVDPCLLCLDNSFDSGWNAFWNNTNNACEVQSSEWHYLYWIFLNCGKIKSWSCKTSAPVMIKMILFILFFRYILQFFLWSRSICHRAQF